MTYGFELAFEVVMWSESDSSRFRLTGTSECSAGIGLEATGTNDVISIE